MVEQMRVSSRQLAVGREQLAGGSLQLAVGEGQGRVDNRRNAMGNEQSANDKFTIEYKIFCGNKDLDGTIIQGVAFDQWVTHNNHTKVWYSSKANLLPVLQSAINEHKPDHLFITGIYDWQYNLKPLLFCKGVNKIISARGMLHPGALSQKGFKKRVYLRLWKMLGLHKKTVFHATDEEERGHIQQAFGRSVNVFVATNFPRVMPLQAVVEKKVGELKLVSVALMSPMKNIKLVLEALERVGSSESGVRSQETFEVGGLGDGSEMTLRSGALRQASRNDRDGQGDNVEDYRSDALRQASRNDVLRQAPRNDRDRQDDNEVGDDDELRSEALRQALGDNRQAPRNDRDRQDDNGQAPRNDRDRQGDIESRPVIEEDTVSSTKSTIANLKSKIEYNIYGPVKDKGYWHECEALIKKLPANIRVNYHGDISPAKIAEALAANHVFILPSKSENYGHAIFEALSAGRPVITSNNTPWNSLESDQAGINVTVSDGQSLVKAIEFFAAMDQPQMEIWSKGARSYSEAAVDVELIRLQYEKMFGPGNKGTE